MTKELRRTLEIIIAQLNSPKKILEVGSRPAENQEDICNLRPLFPRSTYVGVDMQEGEGVDIVADAEKLPFADLSQDLILCLETLEHALHPWKIVTEIERVSTKNGIIILSSQQNFPIHMHPLDYFRYTPYGLASLVTTKKNSLVFGISPPYNNEVKLNPQHVVGIFWNGNGVDQEKIKRELRHNIGWISGHKPYRHRLQDGLKIFKRALSEATFRQSIEFFPYTKEK